MIFEDGNKLLISSQIQPNEEQENIYLLNIDPNFHYNYSPKDINELTILITTNVGTFKTKTLIPLNIFFSEDGKLEQDVYLELFNKYRDTNSIDFPVKIDPNKTVEYYKNKLSINNVYVIADRNIDNKVINIYINIRTFCFVLLV